MDMDIVRSISTLNHIYEISGVEVGQHFNWQIGGFQVHGQVLITSWVVIAVLLGSATIAVRDPQTILTSGQNFVEYILDFFWDLTRTQIGEEEYGPWVPFIGTMFLFIFGHGLFDLIVPRNLLKGVLSELFWFYVLRSSS